MASIPEDGKKVFPALSGLRAIAAYAVYLHHFPDSICAPNTWTRSVVEQGYLGVSLFFVLSGFLIHYTYADRVTYHRVWLKRYFRNRFARIYPLYFLAVVAIHIKERDWGAASWFIDLTLIKGLSNAHKFHGVAQSWSLTVEEVFYVFFLGYVFLSRKYWRGLTLGLLGTYALGAAIAVVSAHGLHSGIAQNITFLAGYTFFGRATDFFVGMFIARCLTRPPSMLHRLRHATALGCAGMVASVVALTALARARPDALTTLTHPLGLGVLNLIFAPAAGLLVWGLALEQSPLQRMLASRPAVLLGRSSYAFYLIHLGPLMALLQASGMTPARHPAMLFALLAAASVALYAWVEKPLHRWLRANQS